MVTRQSLQTDLDNCDVLSRSLKRNKRNKYCRRAMRKNRAQIIQLSNRMEWLEDAIEILDHPELYPQFLMWDGKMNALAVILQMNREF